MNVTYLILLVTFSLSLFTCRTSDEADLNKTPSREMQAQTTENGYTIHGGQIVKKKFVIKNGVESDIEEYYFRLSVQDYFIKFCESNVSKKELEEYLSENKSEDSGLGIEPSCTLEIKIISDGLWDNCNSEHEVQSRVGDYIIINKIVK